jgi:hypothetical protein
VTSPDELREQVIRALEAEDLRMDARSRREPDYHGPAAHADAVLAVVTPKLEWLDAENAALQEHCVEFRRQRDTLAWLHAEAVWLKGRERYMAETYARLHEAVVEERSWLWDQASQLEAELREQCDAWDDEYGACAESVPDPACRIRAIVNRYAAPVSESVPATPADFASLFVHGDHQIKDRPCPGCAAPSGVDLPEVEAAPPTFGCLRIDLAPEWKKGDKALYRAHPDDEGEEVEVRAVAGSTTLVEADPFPFGNPQHWSADVSELSPLPAPAPRCPEIVPDGHESAMECGADPVPGTERCADHTYPSRDSATSAASRVQANSKLEQNLDDATPPVVGEADTKPPGNEWMCGNCGHPENPFDTTDNSWQCDQHKMPRVWSKGALEPADHPPVRDCHGDVWTHVPGTFEWSSPETQNCAWSYMAKKWAPLVEVLPNTEQPPSPSQGGGTDE